MYANRLKKLRGYLEQTQTHLSLHYERLKTQNKLDKLERPNRWLDAGLIRKYQAENEIPRLTKRKLHLLRQIRRLERRARRQEVEPSFFQHVKEHLADIKDVGALTEIYTQKQKENLKSWWHREIKADYSQLSPKSAGDLAEERINANLKKYFPDEWDKKEHARKQQEKIKQANQRYLDERKKTAELNDRRRERLKAKKERQQAREQRKEWAQERPKRLEEEAPKRAKLTEEVEQLDIALREQERKEPNW